MSREEKAPTTAWAPAAPAASITVGVICLILFPVLTGLVPFKASMPLLVPWAMGALICQVTSAIIEFRRGNLLGGSLLAMFGCMVIAAAAFAVPLFEILFGHMGIPINPAVNGYAWAALTLTLCMFTAGYLYSVFWWIFICLDLALAIVTLHFFGLAPHTVLMACGLLVLAAGLGLIYCSCAEIVNHGVGKTIFPLWGPLLKKE